jgi:predicted TPR repeat methyltransferase
MLQKDDNTRAMIEAYDEEARATGWLGPEVAFGLAYEYVQPGQSILDIGIGTGLGSIPFRKAGLKVYGMDISQEMLDACRSKGFTDLARHDLTKRPYPYASESLDHVVCVGVLQFFSDLSPVFGESARILHKGGLFVFVVGDRTENEALEVVVGSEHTKLGVPVTMYRHSTRQINTWINGNGFVLLRSFAFTVYMDRDKTHSLPACAYLVRKREGIEKRVGGDAC